LAWLLYGVVIALNRFFFGRNLRIVERLDVTLTTTTMSIAAIRFKIRKLVVCSLRKKDQLCAKCLLLRRKFMVKNPLCIREKFCSEKSLSEIFGYGKEIASNETSNN
jgi:hypothetical protein